MMVAATLAPDLLSKSCVRCSAGERAARKGAFSTPEHFPYNQCVYARPPADALYKVLHNPTREKHPQG
jgi:hypothetical protein